MQANNSIRYHGFDSLRGIMMLLGVWMHAACAHAVLEDVWWMKDPATDRIFDLQILFMHIFRLPVFFIMAGFFAALLVTKRGVIGFLRNRFDRLAIPFVLFWIAIVPALRCLNAWVWLQGQPDGSARFWRWFWSFGYLKPLEPGHLWFLIVLGILCAGVALGSRFVPAAVPRAMDRAFERAVISRFRVLWFGLLTLGTLLLMNHGVLDTPGRLWPEPRITLAYMVFFGFGWFLFRNRALLEVIRSCGWSYLSSAAIVGMANWSFVLAQMANLKTRFWGPFLGTAATGALITWLMIFGLMGLFLRYLDKPRPALRYLSDSAYWIYLMHPPVLVPLQLMLRDLTWSPWTKMLIVLSIAVPVLYASYHWLVRPTWVDALLNGRRYPGSASNRLPAFETEPTAVGN